MAGRIEIAAVTPADPNATPRVDVVDGTNGGVKVDPAKTPAPVEKQTEARPAWLPEKFKTVEEFAKSYTELEKKLGTPAGTQETVATVTPEAAKKAGIDITALNKEFAETGELSAETLKTLNEKGFDQKAVDSYVAGQTAIAKQIVTDLQSVAGGEKQFTAVIEWAKSNLSAEDIAGYNDALDSGNVKLAKLALAGVVAQYTEANGKVPNLIEGGEAARTSGVAPYESQAQITTDMRTKEYKTDPAFRRKVEARLAATVAPFSR